MPDDKKPRPDITAMRTALWRAMHVQLDSPPHVFEDEIGLQLALSEDGWRDPQDLDPQWTRRIRAAIVARARFVEDLVAEQVERGIGQYVILGAGLDTFAQRRPEIASRLRVFEVDRPEPQAWKIQRLADLGHGVPRFLRFVPVDFEDGASWWQRLMDAGFDGHHPAVVVSTGVSMYLTRAATKATLRQLATLAPGSTVAMTFLTPVELRDPEDRARLQWAKKTVAASGTPAVSFYDPAELLALAREAGFHDARHVPAADHDRRYFSGRTDGLRPSSGEDFLVANT
jgi:methyltransferase (TIGR00027 family)